MIKLTVSDNEVCLFFEKHLEMFLFILVTFAFSFKVNFIQFILLFNISLYFFTI